MDMRDSRAEKDGNANYCKRIDRHLRPPIMSAHPTWRDVLTDGILAERHGADLLFGSAAVRALETAAYRALAPFTLMARAGEAA
ncbi:bifunctional ADP-dependent NAD(P)H-hydrate dehydratase/NAD(P)H-hydrate epimerase, partial [Ralstonia pseudosolanacearum]